MRQTDPDTPLTRQVRAEIARGMELQGFNMFSLSKASGVAHTTVRRFLLGEISPKVDTVDKLFRAMNLEPHFSFD
jgi:transcriptional regulator with XRE-family HTH domain